MNTAHVGLEGSILGFTSSTIPLGESITPAIDLESLRLFAIEVPATITAASITFQGYSETHAAYLDIYDGDTELSYTLGASRIITVDRSIFSSFRKIKIRSGTSETPINQEAALLLGLALRTI